jgi:hypothetical protein
MPARGHLGDREPVVKPTPKRVGFLFRKNSFNVQEEEI